MSIIPEQIYLSRAFGSIIGAFIGDAAGAPLEFLNIEMRHDKIQKINDALEFNGGGLMHVGKGQITDDSEMAMCLLHGLTPGDSEKIILAETIAPQKKLDWTLNIRKI